MKLHILLCMFLVVNSVKSQSVTSAAVADRVNNLPGLSTQLSSAHYSGYLAGVTDNEQLHYWFSEATEDKEKAPLVLWLNGGPGCSSMDGLLNENGPFRLGLNNSLEPHPYSWNKFSNIIYMESPTGVGYSYNKDGVLKGSDYASALQNYHALLNFFAKFPEYRGRDFYITGQSYTGVYAPTLALRILHDTSGTFNLKGVAVGNPFVDSRLHFNSLFYYMYYYGFVDEDSWQSVLKHCCNSECTDRCNFMISENRTCTDNLIGMLDRKEGINPYSVHSSCSGGVPESVLARGHTAKPRRYSQELRELLHWTMPDKKSKFLRQEEEVDEDYYPCNSASKLESYMNLPSVRQALNIPDEAPVHWQKCNTDLFDVYETQHNDLAGPYLQILGNGVSVMLYAGDTNSVINVVGLHWFVKGLDLEVDEYLKPWRHYNDDGKVIVGGMVQELQSPSANLTYVTVRGAGHSVPTDRPIAAEHMIRRFIQGKAL